MLECLCTGKGEISINGLPVDKYFQDLSEMILRQPLDLTKNETTFDIKVNVSGGGESGQLALRMALLEHC